MELNFALLMLTSLPMYALILIIVGAIVLVLFIIYLIIFLLKKKRPTKIDKSTWLIALGGKDNVNSVSATGSRINLSLKEKDIIDREKLKELGVKSILVMSNKVTLVVEKEAERIANSVQESLNS